MLYSDIDFSKAGEAVYLRNRISILKTYLDSEEKTVNVIKKRISELEEQLEKVEKDDKITN